MFSRCARTWLPRRHVKTPTIDWKPVKSNVTNIAKAENQAKLPIFRRTMLGLMIAMPVVSFALGCWQVKRLRWKVDLIARSEYMLAEEPLDGLPTHLDPDAIKDFEHRRFRLKGHFDYAQEMFLGPRLRNGELGYLVIVPFVRSDGGQPILVQRGWIHKDKVIPSTRHKGYLAHLALPQGEVTIDAMFRVMPKKLAMQYDHEKGSRLFHVPDVEAMAEQTGALPVFAQVIYSLKDKPEWKSEEEAKQTGWMFSKKKLDRLPETEDSTVQWQEFEFVNQGVPIGTVPKVSFTNNHMQYLVTWFGVSLASTVLLFYTFYKKRSLGSAEKVIEAKRKDMKKHF